MIAPLAPGRPQLLFSRRLFPLFVVVCAGAFNDNMLRQALIISIVYGAVTAGAFRDPADAIPAIGALFSLATLLCTSAAGQVAEKAETASLLRKIKLCEIVLLAITAVGFAIGSGGVLMAVFVAYSVQIAFFNPARISALPKYLSAEELVRANAYCSAGMFVSIVAGLMLGGILAARTDGSTVVSLALLAVAGIAFCAALALPRAPAEAPDLSIDWNPVGQTVRILTLALTEPGVRHPLFGVAFFYFVSTGTTILVPLYAIENLGADGAAATAIMGLFAAGAGIGAILASTISRRRSGLGFSFFGVLTAGAASLAVFALTGAVARTGQSATVAELVSHPAGVALLCGFFLCSGAMGLYLVPLQAASQRRAPIGKRARILAAGNILSALCAMAGALGVFAITNTRASPAEGLLALSVLQMGIGAYMAKRWFSLPNARYDEMLSPPAAEEPFASAPAQNSLETPFRR